jgi:hypothetical protein
MRMDIKRLWWQDDDIWWCIDYREIPNGLQIVSDPYLAYGGGK